MFRDLGTSLNNLSTLWLSRCCLEELDGISCIGTLKVYFCILPFTFCMKELEVKEYQLKTIFQVSGGGGGIQGTGHMVTNWNIWQYRTF